MIKLEGFEIEEMRSMNHIMTVDLQFDKPVTQAEARNYLSRVLARANESEAKAMKEFCEKNNTGEVVISKDGSLEIADENPEIVNKETENANDEAFDAAVRAEFQKAKKPEKTKGKPGPKRGKIDWDKACALKKAGWSNSEIATEVHTSVGTINSMIYQRLKEYNAGKRSERMEEIEE